MKTTKAFISKLILIAALTAVASLAFSRPVDPECISRPWMPKCILM